MAYAGKAVRTKRFGPARVTDSATAVPAARRDNGASVWRSAAEIDWRRVAVFAGGLGLGAAVGAGAALLLAPRSGAATRRRLRRRIHNAWSDPDDC